VNENQAKKSQKLQQGKRAAAAAALIAALLAIGTTASLGAGMLPESVKAASRSAEPQAGPKSPAAEVPVERETLKAEASERKMADPPQPVSPPVPLNATVTLATGARIRISDIGTVQGEARGPGEVAGPSVRFRVTIDNPTDAAISTEKLLINVESGSDRKPALQLSGPGAVEFSGEVAPRGSASAVYVFNVGSAEHRQLRILFDYGLTEPIAVFEGSV